MFRLDSHPTLIDEELDLWTEDIKPKPEVPLEAYLLEGDHLFYVSIPPEVEFVREM